MLGKKKFELKLMYNLTFSGLVVEDNFFSSVNNFLVLRIIYQECKNLYGNTANQSIGK